MIKIPISKPSLGLKEKQYLNEAIDSGWISSKGKFIEEFEKEFANYCGTKYAITTCNGTTALHLALLALNIKDGDEVIIPDLTFVATANSILFQNAKPIIVDVLHDSLCINPSLIESKISSRTKAIMPVHLYGHPADMKNINEIAKKYNLFVIEDAAEAHGAEFEGKKVGSIGDIGVFSLFGNKIITSGEGGVITTNSFEIANRIKFLRDHGMSPIKKYWHTELAYNYRMTNLQAAIALAQLERIDDIILKKKLIFDWYKEFLSDFKEIKLNYSSNNVSNVYWMITMQFDAFTENTRNEFIKKLEDAGIESRPFFYPISDMPYFTKSDTIITHEKYKIGINLPTFYEITKNEVEYVCSTIINILK